MNMVHTCWNYNMNYLSVFHICPIILIFDEKKTIASGFDKVHFLSHFTIGTQCVLFFTLAILSIIFLDEPYNSEDT